ncbi:stage III sporulation protein AG [Pseudoflavonifractor sp. 524-17]|uniref:stage III sporulation protein AG n=1 Tax=Pseudoflavonifractor sp. 524-17 TaxID=2304577 RepID=UPI0013796500|nr:stage III sporulation protein AG [Pseudoflavonifractor sp. 524-17]NCE64296.1 stage III sporulation protein AG [Pseudoflavonifractor sp. 524-17]
MKGMDLTKLGERLQGLLGKYRYVLLVIAAGVILLLLPSGEGRMPAQSAAPSQDRTAEVSAMEDRLEEVLSQIEGAGRVQVVLTLQAGPRQIWARDTSQEEGEDTYRQEETLVVVSRGSGQEETIPVQQISPQFRGALVVCSGGDDPAVRLSLVEAVSALTGLGSDKISICKGK